VVDESGKEIEKGQEVKHDYILVCIDCGRGFTLTAGERDFYNGRNLSLPKRCSVCRKKRRDAEKTAGAVPASVVPASVVPAISVTVPATDKSAADAKPVEDQDDLS
jgi:hypothetical protein